MCHRFLLQLKSYSNLSCRAASPKENKGWWVQNIHTFSASSFPIQQPSAITVHPYFSGVFWVAAFCVAKDKPPGPHVLPWIPWNLENGKMVLSKHQETSRKSLGIKNNLAMIDVTIIIKLQEIEWFQILYISCGPLEIIKLLQSFDDGSVKPTEGGTEHDGRSATNRDAKVPILGPFFEPKQAPAAKAKIQDKLNKPSFRWVSDMLKRSGRNLSTYHFFPTKQHIHLWKTTASVPSLCI